MIAADLELWVRDCSACRRPVLWARLSTDLERWVPLAPAPSPHGSWLVYPDPDAPRRLLATQPTAAQRSAALAAAGKLHPSHAIDCPRADAYARGPLSMRPVPTGFARRPVSTVCETAEPEGLF